MNFKISKKTIYNGLVTVSRAISANTPLPALSGIKIECTRNKLTLTGSNADISIQTAITRDDEDFIYEVTEEGAIVIEAKYIIEIVRKIDCDVIDFSLVDGSLTKISGDSAEFKINGINASDYPNIDFNKPLQNFKIDADLMRAVISQTTFAASDKETRPILTGVNFSAADGKLECIATDSFRLAKKTITINAPYNFNITIPAKSLNEVEKIIDRDGAVEIAVSEKKIQFFFADTLIQTRLIDGKFPDTSRLIPEEFASSLLVDARDMLNAIDRASFIKNDGIPIVKLALDEKEVVVSSKSQEVGSSVEKLIYEKYNGEPLTISFCGKYVYDAIRFLDTQQISIDFTTDMKPFIIRNNEDQSIIQLILPVRTYN